MTKEKKDFIGEQYISIIKKKKCLEKDKKNSRFRDWPEDRAISIGKNKKFLIFNNFVNLLINNTI